MIVIGRQKITVLQLIELLQNLEHPEYCVGVAIKSEGVGSSTFYGLEVHENTATDKREVEIWFH